MNLQLVNTFLEVVKAGNLNRAAERLHVTQSTVTTRLNALESLLGQTLVLRAKSGVELTAAGFKFQRHAELLVRVWHQARQEMELPDRFSGTLTIGYEADLWDGAVDQWLAGLRQARPEVALAVWAGERETLNRWLTSGLIDVALVFGEGDRREMQPLFEDRLLLVSSRPRPLMHWDPDYILVDWGETFRREHALAYPTGETPALTFGEGSVALRHLLAHDGSGYLPERAVAPYLGAGKLYRVEGAPVFTRPVHLLRSPLMARPAEFDGLLEHFPIAQAGDRGDDERNG